MCKFPVAKQIEKLVPYLVAYTTINESEYQVGEIIKVRKYGKKKYSKSLFSFKAQRIRKKKADSDMRKCIYHEFIFRALIICF
jgi:hypothetical protein